MIFIRHGKALDGDDSLLNPTGVAQVETLRESTNPTKEEYDEQGIRQVFFCSSFYRGFQTANILRFGNAPVVSLEELCPGYDVPHEKLAERLEKIESISSTLGKQVAVVVCHGAWPTLFAELASEGVTGQSIRETLSPRYPKEATGFSVDMETGKVTRV